MRFGHSERDKDIALAYEFSPFVSSTMQYLQNRKCLKYPRYLQAKYLMTYSDV